MDVYNYLWDLDMRFNMYLVLLFVERKASVIQPTITNVITRTLIEDEYDLIGYHSFKINNPDGTLRFGTYTLDLFREPIYLEEMDANRRSGH